MGRPDPRAASCCTPGLAWTPGHIYESSEAAFPGGLQTVLKCRSHVPPSAAVPGRLSLGTTFPSSKLLTFFSILICFSVINGVQVTSQVSEDCRNINDDTGQTQMSKKSGSPFHPPLESAPWVPALKQGLMADATSPAHHMKAWVCLKL